MRKLLIGIVAVLVLLVAAIVALPLLVPTDAVVARLEREVAERTGRKLEIAGPVDVSVIPNVAVTLGDVSFEGAPGGPDMLKLGRLELRLELWPLLSGEARVSRFVLIEPAIALEIDQKGRANWDFAVAHRESGQSGAGSAGPVQDIVLGDVEIVDGRLTFTDRRSGTAHTLQDLDATVRLDGFDAPLILEAAMSLDGRPVAMEARARPARALIEGGKADVTVRADAAGATLDLKGGLDRPAGGGASFGGDLAVAIDSLPDLLEWFAGTRPAALPVDGLSLNAQLRVSPKQVALNGLNLQADGIVASGDVSTALGGARPAVQGRLAVSRLDLDRLMPPAPAGVEGGAAPAGATGGSGGAAGWSRDPIDLSALRLADVDMRASLAGVVLGGVEAGATTLAVDLRDGRLRATLGDTAIFGGTVKGEVAIDGRAATPAWQIQVAASGVQAEPVLKRFAGFDRLTGTTEGRADLRTGGASVHDLMRNMDGAGALVFHDGAVRGVNIAQMVRSVTGGTAEGPQQTDFAEMGGTFRIEKGTALNDDFRMIAPLLRVTGGGRVMLPERQVDFRIVPRLVASIEGQGAARADQRGLSVPILVQGTFDDLGFKPDLASIATETLKDPAAVKEQIQGVRDAIKGAGEGANPGQAMEGLLKGLLGGQPAQPPPDRTQPQPGGQ